MPDTVRAPDPTPRTLEQMYRELKGLEDKISIRLLGYDEAVKLLQALANRQPTTEAVDGDVKALKELTAEQFAALRELMVAKFDGNKTALDAALKTQKEASDKIESNFSKQFDNLDGKINDLKDRVNGSEGRSKGLGDGWVILVGAVGALGVLASIVTALLTRT